MKEIGILFQDDMSRAIVDGRKTLTSRLIKPQPFSQVIRGYDGQWYDADCCNPARPLRCPYGQPGDVLIGRECWGMVGDKVVYRADPASAYQWGPGKPSQGDFRWRSSMVMPWRYTRLRLLVLRVWPSRLQDMTEEMAQQEGCEPAGNHNWDGWPKTYLIGYSQLWDRINAKKGCSWAFNPWVWRVEFQRIKP